MITKPQIDRNYRYPEGIIAPWEFGELVLGFKFYEWQGEFLEAIGQGLPSSLLAANGSGKTQVVLTTAVLWFLYTYPKGVAPVTSGSWTQLTHQMWPAIEQHRFKFPKWHWTSGKIETPEGGRLVLFSVMDPGRAEGYHGNPTEDAPCMYIIDEAKSVNENIFIASDRCTVQFRILASSPGETVGRLYDSFNRLSSFYYTKRITSFDCKHIADRDREIDREKYGESSPTYRSKHLGEFTDDEGPGVIISRALLAKCIANPPKHKPGRKTLFCDFAAGRDENVLALCDGNKVEILDAWCEEDTMQACCRFVRHFSKLSESMLIREGDIFGDNGGIGKGMIDRILDLGWSIRRIDFGGDAREHKTYSNRGTEIWFETIRQIEKCELILPDDQVFFDQATCRRRLYDGRGRLIAEPKKQMFARGLSSPDRADAVLGALWSRKSGGISGLEDLAAISIPNSPFQNLEVTEYETDYEKWQFG
jgi:hypothetical protein